MHVHYLQHVSFEGLGSIELVLREKGHQLSATHLYATHTLPRVDNIDWLIVMGGPMGIYDDARYPWLKAEKELIKEAINAGKIVLGICLGAQLIADALGARVYNNTHREIGWFRVNQSPEASNCTLSQALPEEVDVFHWHGDTFDIPQDAILLAESEACKHQGFILDHRVAAFQFHLETTFQSATALIENCRDELDGAQYVQSEAEILVDRSRFSRINQVMTSVLDALEAEHV